MDKLQKCQEQLVSLAQYNFELENELELLKQDVLYEMKHDPITGVLSNNSLVKELQTNQNKSYFLLNIDNFGNINSAYGFLIGNEVLVEVARLLKRIINSEYRLYRFCADKFVLISQRVSDRDEVSLMAESILSFFNASDVLVDNELPIPISFSIGISTCVGIMAITQAEIALKEARKSQKNSYYIYEQKFENLNRQQENIYWINKIKKSILEEEVIVHYQPIRNNITKKIEKYECLSRIYDDGELVSPFSFMEAAIATRVLHLMTQSVIESAYKKFSKNEYEFSINITKDDLFLSYLEPFLLKNCKKYNISPSRVVLEILEDISTLNEKNILEQLNSLKMSGFKIAIDDFGAENSNFSRLLEFKPDYLKIDGAFIKNIATDKDSRIITQAIVGICKESNIKVIAEFIHNEEVQKIIEELEIEYSQGYYIGAPSTELL